MNNAYWITMMHPECSIWKREKFDGAREKRYKEETQRLHGSYLFRKKINIGKDLVFASASVCGLGYYELRVNGKKPDEDLVLTPVLSNYFQLCRYDTYDITDLLKYGENTLITEVCDGWYSPEEKWWGWQYSWHGDSRMIAEITLEYKDGRVEKICSDESWQWAPGIVLSGSIYDGEIVDFNRVPKEEDWKTSVLAEAPTDNLVPTDMPPVRITRALKPVEIRKFSDTESVYDFGENLAAVPCFVAKGKKGDKVTLRHAEFQYADGTPDYRSQNTVLSTDIFTLTDDVCICQPRFVWHGYRYVKLELSSPDIRILSAESKVLHTDLTVTGGFESDNEALNHFHEVALRTQLACTLGVPIDCPQRNERKAWLGDAHVTAELCVYNYDMREFYASLLEDIRLDTERNGDAPFICPGDYNRTTTHEGETTSIDYNIAYPIFINECYKRYKDIELIRKHLPALKLNLAHYEKTCKDGILPVCWFGDWFSLDLNNGTKRVAFEAGGENHRQNPPYLATMFYCRFLRLVRDMALEVGDNAYAEKLDGLRAASEKALYKRCYHKDTGKYGDGRQFLSAFALAEHLVKPADEKKVLAELLSSLKETDYHPLVGVVGMRLLFDVLSDYGYPDIAYKVLTVEGYPGLLDMAGHGRTTLTEGQDGSGSGCHTMFGSPDAQLYKLLCGIRIDRTKDVPITVMPFCPEGMNHAKGFQLLDEGKVEAEWKKTEKSTRFDITVPAGLTARVILPGRKPMLLQAGAYTFRNKNN